MHKQNMVYPSSGILFSHERNGILIHACYNKDELEIIMLLKEVSHKDHILYDSIYMKCPEEANL